MFYYTGKPRRVFLGLFPSHSFTSNTPQKSGAVDGQAFDVFYTHTESFSPPICAGRTLRSRYNKATSAFSSYSRSGEAALSTSRCVCHCSSLSADSLPRAVSISPRFLSSFGSFSSSESGSLYFPIPVIGKLFRSAVNGRRGGGWEGGITGTGIRFQARISEKKKDIISENYTIQTLRPAAICNTAEQNDICRHAAEAFSALNKVQIRERVWWERSPPQTCSDMQDAQA